jgi:hypothetical protein
MNLTGLSREALETYTHNLEGLVESLEATVEELTAKDSANLEEVRPDGP